jgi:transcriptional regulator with XRE-family HTH domain
MSFGYALRKFREERGLSLREFGRLCNIDYAYIHRLEKGEKTAPSAEAVNTLVRKLKLDSRRAHILRFLVGREASSDLIEVFLEDEERPVEDFESLAQMSFRGMRPENKDEWRKWADVLDDLFAE